MYFYHMPVLFLQYSFFIRTLVRWRLTHINQRFTIISEESSPNIDERWLAEVNYDAFPVYILAYKSIKACINMFYLFSVLGILLTTHLEI